MTQTVTVRLATGNDDAMANATSVNLTSSGVYLNGKYGALSYDNYLRFTGIHLPTDAVVTDARLGFTVRDIGPKASNFATRIETSAAAAFTATPASFTSRTFTDFSVDWIGAATAAGLVVSSANLSALVQAALAAQPGRTDYVFKLTGLTPDNAFVARAYNGYPTFAPTLTIEYTSAHGQFEATVAAADGDAEEYGVAGAIALEDSMQIGGYFSATLAPAYKESAGFRFANVQLPATAEIDDAYIEFTTWEVGPAGRASNMVIRSELGDAAPYTAVAYGVTSRPYGDQTVEYTQLSFTRTLDKVRTPNLARLIDENRILGWQTGQGMGFMVTGTDFIGSVYPGGNVTYRAKLVIEYHAGNGPSLDGATNLVKYSVSPGGGYYSAPVNVAITADQPGVVTYTTDGTDPGPGVGQTYTGPVAIGAGRTQLKIYVAGGIKDSGVKTYNYLVGDVGQEVTQTETFTVATVNDDAMANATQVDLANSGLPLHSQYTAAASYDSYVRFTGVDLPADAVVTGAHLTFTLRDTAAKAGQIAVSGELTERGTYQLAPGSFKGRDYTSAVTLDYPAAVAGATYNTGDIGAVVAAQYAANPAREDYAFKIHGLTPSNPFTVRSFYFGAAYAPKLVVEFYSNYGHSTTAITAVSDDAEEFGPAKAIELGGAIQMGGYYGAANTEAVRDVTGFRFQSVQIPDSATLVRAYIQFTTYADGPVGKTSNLTIRSELGNAATYPVVAGAITNRTYSIGAVPWQVSTFNQSLAKLRTPDLKDLIDEARLAGWTNGQALAFKFDGDGYIGSVYAGPGVYAATLYVEYRFDGGGVWDNVITDPAQVNGIYINELSTSGTKANEDDWLELYNASDSFIWLGPGIRLWRDGTKKGDTFDFTGLLVPPHAYRILYADEKTSQGPDHLSFDFKKSGEVNLTDMSSGSVRVIDAFAYGEQLYLETHARVPDGGLITLMAEETYGYSNDKAPQKYTLNFSHDRGVYDTGFTLTLTSVPGSTIRYTTDGSTPSATKGTIYLGPITVNKSMSVRAVAYDARGTSTPQTMTYVLLDNLKNETQASWSRWTPVNKATIDDAAYAQALSQLPIVSINSDVVELSHAIGQDYVQAYFEYMPEVGSGEADFAQPIGVKRFGQASIAQYNSGIAVRFKKDYGAGKAKYEFFDSFAGEPYALTGEYKKLELHEGQDGAQPDGWYAPGYLRYDEMMTRLLANQMGIFDSHTQYVHYFYNGQYAGIKTMREDYGPQTFEPYFGVDSDDYTKVSYQDDICFQIGCVETGDGEQSVMQAVHRAANSGNYQTFQQYVDVESLIRNMILFHYIDCENEWNGVVENSVGSGGMKMMFNINDSDGAFYNQGSSLITYSSTMDGGGGNYRYKWVNPVSMAGPYGMFRTWTRYDTADLNDGNLEFKTRVKDDVLELIGPASGDFRGAAGAPLSVDNVQALLLEQQATLEVPYRLDAAYMGALNQWSIWKNYNPKVIAMVPERTKYNLEQWAKYGLTHTLPAVVATSAGDSSVTLSVANSSAVIYYTLDGSDPMGANGATPGQSGANPAAQAYTTGTVLPAGATTRAFTPGNWGPLSTF
jgi:hypothetical protein